WLYDRLAAAELIPERDEKREEREAKDAHKSILAPFLEAYIAKRGDVKPSTKLLYNQTKTNLCTFFGRGKPLTEITAGAAADFKRWLLTEARVQKEKSDSAKAGVQKKEGLAKATANRRTRCAKHFFEEALDHEIISKNPFRKVKGGSSVNKERMYFVPWDDAQKILDECPNAEWRAIVALVRFGGIRCPSELLPLKWEDVNFRDGMLTITSPKTAHADKPYRVIPEEVFCDVRPYLEDLLEVARARGPVKPTDYVITQYRQKNANLRTQFIRIMKRAGVEPWPKIFQNCRSSRETELIYMGYQIHEVCKWIGNSPQVAHDHYLQVLDSAQKLALEGSARRQCKRPMHGGKVAGNTPSTARGCKWDGNGRGSPAETKKNRGFSGAIEHAREDSNL
ncbi:MAG: site-specific integrase, partial [Pirellulaceae bacterium]|nr:site-specific integrase [Pirellulaceae bacterium]